MSSLSPRLIYLKAALFLVIGVLCVTSLLLITPRWDVALLIGLTIWSFARLYYFAFYVIEHYIDPNYHFASLTHCARYLLVRRKTPPTTSP